jgi:ATP-binding cassette subfamily B protein
MTFVRHYWRDATLLCVSHDVAETQDFDRVLVVDAGAIVEDGSPRDLATADTRYCALLTAERDVRERLWSSARWRHLRIDDGRLVEAHGRTEA